MKLKQILYLKLLLGILLSCSAPTNKSNEAKIENNENLTFETSELEIEVIQSILKNLKKSSPKPPPSFLIPKINESKEEFDKRVKPLIEEIHQKWDTTIFEFAINDTLFSIELTHISELLDSSFIVDTSSSVFDHSLKTINLSLIKKDGFKLIDIPYTNFKEFSQRDEFHSILTFSKMLFNQDKSQVIFYYSMTCGTLCGGGGYVKYKKTVNGWEYVASTLFSVS